jgi:hypothetical protein
MNERPGARPDAAATAADTGSAQHIEYRIAHLRERFAAEEPGELGVRVEARGNSVTVIGTVPTALCRDELMQTVNEELAGLLVRFDIVVAEAAAPDHPEELA